MNKAMGATTLGAALLAGLMLQTKTSGPPGGDQPKSIKAPSSQEVASSDGPWVASCDYWSSARTIEDPDEGTPSPPDVTIAQTNGVKLELKPSEDKATCKTSLWGIPKFGDHDPEISVIIATVPDPIHSHLALDFDRSIDAILLAAADNHYLSSNYWLPWRSQISTSSAGDSTATATKSTEADNAREHLPGLIILRYAPEANEWKDRSVNGFERTNYRRVIYLFLIGETPALGVNGNQLQNAFSYEKILKDNYHATLSIRPWSLNQAGAAKNQQFNAAGKQQIVPAGRQSNAAVIAKSEHAVVTESETEQITSCPKRDDALSIIGPIYSGSAASLHAGIQAALPHLGESQASISGITATEIAVRELDPNDECIYRSFGEDTAFEQDRFLQSLAAAHYDLSRVAVLSEAGTVFGGNSKRYRSDQPASLFRNSDVNLADRGTILYLRFPRELSLLRNAEPNQSQNPEVSAPPTPYLNLSLKDYAADDTVPRFSTNQSPLSIEAQLMAIAHQLQRARSQFIVISASNELDDLFLSQFLHRACPDARLVILSGGDLLFERDVEDTPYIGSISISPYLLSSLDFGNRIQWLHANYEAEAVYNAASFTFWNSASDAPPILAGYRNFPVDTKDESPVSLPFQQIPLWATVIGADGYYPLAILNWCGSDLPAILPTLKGNKPLTLNKCSETATGTTKIGPYKTEQQPVWKHIPESINQNSDISPSLPWGILVGFIFFACVLHCAFLWGADFWSPFTRDLAIEQNDLPHRRCVYLNIGTSVIVAMAVVTAFPLIVVANFYPVATTDHVFAWLTIIAAGVTGSFTFVKTRPYCRPPQCPQYTFFNLLSVVALVVIIVLWICICYNGSSDSYPTYAGLYFSFRCLRPLSGVCPLLPVLLLLLAWYLWSIYQTARLRFSEVHRPHLAGLFDEQQPKLNSQPPTTSSRAYLPSVTPYPLFVPDDALANCSSFRDCCLYVNIMCLLITREVLYRFCRNLTGDSRKLVRKVADKFRKHIDLFLLCIYLILFGFCVFGIPIHSIERFLFTPFLFAGWPRSYELLIMALFFPLIMVALSGWLRVILIWGAMSRGLLEPLERMPIRFAFTRFKGGGWMSMLRQKGLHIRWRDMGRSTESIRQLVHHPDLRKKPTLYGQLSEQYEVINVRIRELMDNIKAGGSRAPSPPIATPKEELVMDGAVAAVKRAEKIEGPNESDPLWDVPKASADLCSIYRIEQGYAEFCRLLLDGLLVPYWDQKRTGHVEEVNLLKEENDKSEEQEHSEPSFIQLAEELIVVRYVALIRAVLINIRYLMVFVSTAFVLALIAWNSYPFQPHAFIDWCFTILLATLTLGFVWVFAQMHRNAILSRITDTTANELGWEFYLRIVTFGAVPILTWLAYQFPTIGGSLYKIIQPGLQVVK